MPTFFITKSSTDAPNCEEDVGYVPVQLDASVDETGHVLNWLVFKDQTTSTLYKLKVDDGELVIEEVV